jgi:hypothetical protein
VGRKKSYFKKILLISVGLFFVSTILLQLQQGSRREGHVRAAAPSKSSIFTWYDYPFNITDGSHSYINNSLQHLSWNASPDYWAENYNGRGEAASRFYGIAAAGSMCDVSLVSDSSKINGVALADLVEALGNNPQYIIAFDELPIIFGANGDLDSFYAHLYTVEAGEGYGGTSQSFCKVVDNGEIVVRGGAYKTFYEYIDAYQIAHGFYYEGEQVRSTVKYYNVVPKTDAFYTTANAQKYITTDMANTVVYNWTDNQEDITTNSPADGCTDWVRVNVNNPPKGLLVRYTTAGVCEEVKEGPREIDIGSIANFDKTKALTATAENVPEEVNTPPGTINPSCESKTPVFGWLLCKILEGTDAMVEGSTGIIKGLLTIERHEYEGGTADGLGKAWGAIRLISTVLIVGIALFMILSQIFGFDVFSAYSIKKIMPRLVVAVILIQLSWFLATNFVAVINVVGKGLEELLYAPFGGESAVGNIGTIMGKFQALTSSPDAAGIEFMGAGLVIGAVAFAASGGIFGIVAVAVAIIIAIVTALAILTLRKVLLVFLLVLSPLAIAMWILPNTQKTWQKWRENFFKLLLMFPLIAGFLAIGKIFASISATTGEGSLLTYFIIIVSYFGPFFMIPKTFKMSGTMMSKLADGVNSFGTRAKKGIMESKPAQNLKTAHKENVATKGLERTNSGKWYKKAYGQLQAGTLGYYGVSGARKRGQEKETDRKNAAYEYSQAMVGLGRDDAEKARLAISEAPAGSSVKLANGKSVKTSRRIQNANALASLPYRDHAAVDAYMKNLEGDKAGQAEYRDFILANYKDFEAIVPDIARSDRWFDGAGKLTGGITKKATSLKPAVAHYDDMGDKGENRQLQVRDSLVDLNSSTNVDGSTNVDERREVVGHLNTLTYVNMKEKERVELFKDLADRGVTDGFLDSNLVKGSNGGLMYNAYTDASGNQKIRIVPATPTASGPGSGGHWTQGPGGARVWTP